MKEKRELGVAVVMKYRKQQDEKMCKELMFRRGLWRATQTESSV